MPKLRVEFTSVGSARGRLGGQVDARTGEPLGAVTLEVTSSPTASGDRPLVPSGLGTVFAEFTALEAPAYVDIGPAPDPTLEPRLLLQPGRPKLVHVMAGHAVSAIAAPDVPLPASISPVGATDRSGTLAAGGSAQQACAANPTRRLLLIANPDDNRAFWFNTTGAAGGSSCSVQVGPGGAFVFDRVVPSGAVSVFGPSAGQPFTVKEA